MAEARAPPGQTTPPEAVARHDSQTQRAAEILDELKGSEEPVAILQRSQKQAYLIDAGQYDAERAELSVARRQLFLREVREAEEEYRGGKTASYENMDALLDDLLRAALHRFAANPQDPLVRTHDEVF